MGKKKDKKKQSSEVFQNELDETADQNETTERTGGSKQAKTGKKKMEVDDWEDDIQNEISMLNLNDSKPDEPSQDANESDSFRNKQGKKGKKKRETENWEDEVQDEIGVMASGEDKSASTQASESETKHSNQTKGKQGKKGKKKKDDWEDDVENEISMLKDGKTVAEEKQNVDDSQQDSSKKQKGKKGKKKKELDNWEDDIQGEISMMASGEDKRNPPLEVQTETEKQTTKSKTQGKKGKKKTKEADNWDDEFQDASTKESEVKPDEKDQNEQQKQKSQKKKGKKKKEADDWEDDVLNELAMIESGKVEEKDEPKVGEEKKSGKKKKSAAKETKAEEAPTPVSVTKAEPSPKPADEKTDDNPQEPTEESETSASSKKKKKKKKGEKEEEKAKKKPSKAIKAMQEALRKRKEEEERLQREEEERARKEEEAYQKKLEEIERERLRREKKKQDKKDKIARQKREGTYLTPTQKEAKKKREQYLQMLKEQGLEIPEKGPPARRPKYERKKKPAATQQSKTEEESPKEIEVEPESEPEKTVEEEIEEEKEESETEDNWEMMAEVDEPKKREKEKAAVTEEEDESESGEEESSSEESESEEEEEELAPRELILKRIEKLREKNEKNRTTDDLRSPVICVMGHVDTGKTKILDKIRKTNVQDGEAGGITQQIGATNIPEQAIKEQTKMVKNFADIKVPGLLVIDTPGHESFSNLRSRGSSNCDMAILVVDIMHGLEPQTIESINMLRKKKTPYVVALNKIDRLYEWKPNPKADIVTTLKQQKQFTLDDFKKRVNQTIAEFAQQNLNAKLFYENDDPDTWISMVPTSAHSGDGMGNLMAYVVQHCQTALAKRLAFSENLQCTVLEVKAIQGLGTTVDVILTNGRLKYGDTIVLAGVEGPIVTHIKALLMPQPLKELRVKNPYDKYNEVKAAQGVKVLAKELDKALAGTSLLIASRDDEVDILKEEVQAEIDRALKGIKLQERGVFVQASTLGSLEALLEFLKQSKIPYAGINIGPVHKKDVMKASVMLEHDDQWAVILAFDVKVEREAQELADSLDVKVFTADIIYHLFDAFMLHREDLKKRKQDEFRHLAVFPCKLKIVPTCVFKSRDPIVVGVNVEAGQLRVGTPVCVPSRDHLNVGIVASIESNHKAVEIARKGQEVCIKIDGVPGEPPKMVGRHFEETDILISKISRDSIDLLKNWFRDDMQKSDWQLIVELKKLFEII